MSNPKPKTVVGENRKTGVHILNTQSGGYEDGGTCLQTCSLDVLNIDRILCYAMRAERSYKRNALRVNHEQMLWAIKNEPHVLARRIVTDLRKKAPDILEGFVRAHSFGDFVFPQEEDILIYVCNEIPPGMDIALISKTLTYRTQIAKRLLRACPGNLFITLSYTWETVHLLDRGLELRSEISYLSRLRKNLRIAYTLSLNEPLSEVPNGMDTVFVVRGKKDLVWLQDDPRYCPCDTGEIDLDGACTRCLKCVSRGRDRMNDQQQPGELLSQIINSGAVVGNPSQRVTRGLSVEDFLYDLLKAGGIASRFAWKGKNKSFDMGFRVCRSTDRGTG